MRLPSILLTLACLVCGCAAPSGPSQALRYPEVPRARPLPYLSSETIDEALTRGIDFIVKSQKSDGAWGHPHSKYMNVATPIPGGYHAYEGGASALCLAALIESGDDREEVLRAIERAEDWMFDEFPSVRRAGPDNVYNNWAHAYGVLALLRMRDRVPGDAGRIAKIDEIINLQIKLLHRYESLRGGWGYYSGVTVKPTTSASSFITATVMISLRDAQEAGFEVPQRLIDRGLAALERCLKPDFTYLYADTGWFAPGSPVNLPAGGLSRAQVCNMALRRWGDERITDQVFSDALNRFCARNGWISLGRKRPLPHESFFRVAGYYFYYGNYYASLTADTLKEDERWFFRNQIAHILLKHQEKDGSWWDFPLFGYHKAYGSGFAVMALNRCRRPAATIVMNDE